MEKKGQRLEVALARLKDFRSYTKQGWPQTLESAPVVSALMEVKDAVLACGVGATLTPEVRLQLTEVVQCVEMWNSRVLRGAYDLICDLCENDTAELKEANKDNLLTMVAALLDFGIPDILPDSEDLHAYVPALKQCQSLVGDLPKLVAVAKLGTTLSWEDGQFVRTCLSAFTMDAVWARHICSSLPPDPAPQSVPELQEEVLQALQGRFLSEAQQAALFEKLTKDMKLRSELETFLQDFPVTFKEFEKPVSSGDAWKVDEKLSSFIKSAAVVGDTLLGEQLSYIQIFKTVLLDKLISESKTVGPAVCGFILSRFSSNMSRKYARAVERYVSAWHQ